MGFIDEIKNKLAKEDFSFELLNYCKNHFQYGGFDENDIAEFKVLFSDNIKKSLPYLNQQQIKQICQVCIDRGIYDIQDILFLDSAAFAVKSYDSFYGEKEKKIDFILESKEYRWCDFLDITFFFTNKKLDKNDDLFLERLRNELNNIFVNYYNITTFPEKLGINEATSEDFAIKYDVEQIIHGLNFDLPFSISIIGNIRKTNEILLTKLTYNPNGEKLISIDKVDKNVIKLSDLLNAVKNMKLNNGSMSYDLKIKGELESQQSLLESRRSKQVFEEKGPIFSKKRK